MPVANKDHSNKTFKKKLTADKVTFTNLDIEDVHWVVK
jgi:hypothetical protein